MKQKGQMNEEGGRNKEEGFLFVHGLAPSIEMER
jgi:hypothetical protein